MVILLTVLSQTWASSFCKAEMMDRNMHLGEEEEEEEEVHIDASVGNHSHHSGVS
jgi:hypothetical protein